MLGEGLWENWFDKDLGLTGKVTFINKEGALAVELWDSKETLLNIPSPNIDNEESLKSILASSIVKQLMGDSCKLIKDSLFCLNDEQYSKFLQKIAVDCLISNG